MIKVMSGLSGQINLGATSSNSRNWVTEPKFSIQGLCFLKGLLGQPGVSWMAGKKKTEKKRTANFMQAPGF
jgi:hypothetical protein